jgi:hypothetical protein
MEKTFAQSWLSLQNQMIPHVIAGGAIFPARSSDKVKPAACWPDENSANSSLLAAANLAMSRQVPVMAPKKTAGINNDVKISWSPVPS